MNFHHRPQATQLGCLYLSVHALTGDSTLLEHLHDASTPRFYVRLAERGLMAFTLFCAEPPLPGTPAEFWTNLRARFTASNATGERHAPLLVSIPGGTPGWLHQVAVALPIHPDEDTVHVSDSNFPTPLECNWTAFLGSEYGEAHRVEMLGPLDVDAYPAGGDMPEP